MKTWNDGVKEVCRELAEKRARELDLEWMNDYTNDDRFKAATEAWDKVRSYR